MNRQHFLVCVILFFFHCAHAQDQTNFAHFYLNPYLLNPSYVGIDGQASVAFLYRRQWATLEDGPQMSNVSFHAPISRRISFGFIATDDKKGLLHSSGGMLSFAYNMPLGPQSFFRFGMSGGVASNSVDLAKLDGLNDPALGTLLDNNLSVLGNAGISVHLHTFHAGFSLPVIFAPSYVSKDAFTITKIDPFQSIIFHFSNRFYFNNDRNVFEPYAVYRMTNGLPPQFEVAGILHMNHAVWVGGAFKEDFGISALGGIKLRNTLAIGASYTLKNSGINELNSPTYEVSLGVLLGKRRDETPLYSFVHTEKEKIKKKGKSSSELLAEKRKQDEIARKKSMDEAAKKKEQEEIAKKQELINAQRAQEQEKKKQEEELRRQQALAQEQARQNQATQTLVNQNQPNQTTASAEALKKQQEEARLQQQETARRQQEEIAKRQQEEIARKQQEEIARKQQEEAARRQQEETARRQQEETARRQQEEIARKQQEEIARTQQEEARRREAQLAEQRRQEEAQAQARRQQEQSQQEQLTSTIRQDTVFLKHKPRFNHIDATMEVLNVEVTEHNEQDEKERIARLALHADDPDAHHEGENHPNAERHEFVKKGTHEDELDVADYVVTGVFKEESNARHFTDGLKKLGFKAQYGHLTEKAVWYVYLHQGSDINEARTERDRYRKMKLFRDAWLLTVHH
jgi:type IX secretion system PorP/SprF family membrane protein